MPIRFILAVSLTEWFQVRNGQIADTQYNMVSQYEVTSLPEVEEGVSQFGIREIE